MDRPIVRIPAYLAFGFAVFLVALVVTFPDQRIKEIATVQLESKLGGDYDVEIEDLDLWWLSGLELENVTLSERKMDSGGDDASGEKSDKNGGRASDKSSDGPPKEKPFEMTIPRIAGGFSVLASIANMAPTVDFLVDMGGGDISGTYVHGSDKREVNVDIDDIALAKSAAIESFLGVPVLGTLGGEARLEFHPTRALLTGGEVTLAGEKLMVDKATIYPDNLGAMAFLDVPPTSFGTLDARLVIDKAKGQPNPSIKFEEFKFHGGRDVRGEVWGDINLGRTMAASRAKIQMRFQFDDKYIRTNDLTSVLKMKYFRQGKGKDYYGFVLSGRLSKPRFNGAPTAARGPGGGEAKKSKKGGETGK